MKTSLGKDGIRAFTLLELCVVISTIALVVLLLIPAITSKPRRPHGINCTNNLKQVGLAFRMWSDDNGMYPMLYKTNDFDGPGFATQNKIYIYFQAMSNELSTPKVVVCPGDTARTPGTNFFSDFGNSRVSYFVGLDADETRPQMFLAGDRNLVTNGSAVLSGLVTLQTNTPISWSAAIHNCQGNVALADGSVQSFTSSGVQLAVQHTGTNVTRLVFP